MGVNLIPAKSYTYKQANISIHKEKVLRATNTDNLLDKIAMCESGGKQFDKNGYVIRGKKNKYDIGKYQINEKYWGKKSKKLGYNIFSLKGNTEMAMWIYKNYGSKPWTWSKKCWGEK